MKVLCWIRNKESSFFSFLFSVLLFLSSTVQDTYKKFCFCFYCYVFCLLVCFLLCLVSACFVVLLLKFFVSIFFLVSLMCDFVFSYVPKLLCVLIYICVVVLVFSLFTLLLCYFIFCVYLYSGSFVRPLILCESLTKIFHMLSFKYNGKLARDKSFLINLLEDWTGEITCIKCESENSFLISKTLLFLLLGWCFLSLFFFSYLFPSLSPFSLLSFFLIVWSCNNLYWKNQEVYRKNH